MQDDPTERSTQGTTPAVSGPTHTTLRAPGYEVQEVIGRGGMGEVVLARDRRIGRDVAIKRMLTVDPTGDEVSLFLREARIQARLDHPAVLPVFEIGHDEEGRPFFTMKRLLGTTLYDALKDKGTALHPLLRTFVDVCLAIDLAHSKGVIHCDLKPTNVMLGNYGEVYVIDWGIAQVVANSDDSVVAELSAFEVGGRGTPGYMAPEQALGAVSPASDVYALGCVLFEILTREPLDARSTDAVTKHATKDSAVRRRPDRMIPPELDVVCGAALAESSIDRPTARELADRVQHYLDGDRDVELRRSMGATELANAQAALMAGDRGTAMQAGGVALALDPRSQGAAAIVTQLMLSPPDVPPASLRADLDAADAVEIRRHARRAALAYLGMIPLFPLSLWNGILSWPTIIAACTLLLVLSGYARWLVRRPLRGLGAMTVYAVGNAVLIGILARVFGPFTFVPALACLITMSMTAYPLFARRSWLLVGCIAIGWTVPIVLEVAGVIGSTWTIEPHGMLINASVFAVHGSMTSTLLFTTCLFAILIAGFLAGAVATGHLDAKHRLVTQAWQLRQLLPRGAVAASS